MVRSRCTTFFLRFSHFRRRVRHAIMPLTPTTDLDKEKKTATCIPDEKSYDLKSIQRYFNKTKTCFRRFWVIQGAPSCRNHFRQKLLPRSYHASKMLVEYTSCIRNIHRVEKTMFLTRCKVTSRVFLAILFRGFFLEQGRGV